MPNSILFKYYEIIYATLTGRAIFIIVSHFNWAFLLPWFMGQRLCDLFYLRFHCIESICRVAIMTSLSIGKSYNPFPAFLSGTAGYFLPNRLLGWDPAEGILLRRCLQLFFIAFERLRNQNPTKRSGKKLPLCWVVEDEKMCTSACCCALASKSSSLSFITW